MRTVTAFISGVMLYFVASLIWRARHDDSARSARERERIASNLATARG